MRQLHAAMEDIHAIRVQIARASEFRGYGPGSVAATGLLAFLAAAFQSYWAKGASEDWHAFLPIWILTAAVCVILTTLEMIVRTRAIHGGLAREMIGHAIEQTAPTLMASLLLTFVFVRFVPNALWMLPGLWQILFGVGVFASRSFLPKPIGVVGAWYLATGLICLALTSNQVVSSAWAMGVPFGLGQLFFAVVLWHRAGYASFESSQDDE